MTIPTQWMSLGAHKQPCLQAVYGTSQTTHWADVVPTRSMILQEVQVGKCNSMPLVRLGLTICVVKCSYFLVRHRVSKITLLFCLGGSRQSLKVRKVKCIPGDPATTCPVLFKGSRSLLLLA